MSVLVLLMARRYLPPPRPPGAAMAVALDGEALGSISGGCVEGAVYGTAEQVLAGDGAVVETYGYSDDEAFAVGLTCGGTLEVLVAPADRDVHDPAAFAGSTHVTPQERSRVAAVVLIGLGFIAPDTALTATTPFWLIGWALAAGLCAVVLRRSAAGRV